MLHWKKKKYIMSLVGGDLDLSSLVVLDLLPRIIM